MIRPGTAFGPVKRSKLDLMGLRFITDPAGDTGGTAPAGEQDEQGTEHPKEFEAITSQEDFDKAIQARIARERAKFADYDDVKAKADKLVALENANKTEAQQQADRLAEIERENAELKSGKLRAEVAAAKGVPASLLSGSTQADLEAAADALIAFKGAAAKPSAAAFIEGANKVTPEQDFDAAIAAAEKARNFPLVITLKQQKAAQKG